ncbi:hypothetical protein F4554_000401 [Actinopolymorpha rutila]|uniref:Uncharacterized protein n=1 Tax=Actinopolymorpha rutila TaxID=446787 RepID=A0A852Z5V5_9ACTN|nr:hypothetical protein [Actinopolymorpha rutila]
MNLGSRTVISSVVAALATTGLGSSAGASAGRR